MMVMGADPHRGQRGSGMRTFLVVFVVGIGWLRAALTADAATLPNPCTYLGHSGGDNGDGGDGNGGGQGGGQGGQGGGSGDSGRIGDSGSIERTALTGLTRRPPLGNSWRGGHPSRLRPSPPGW